MAKMIIGFIIGAVMMLGLYGVQLVRAAYANPDEQDGLYGLVPDIAKINREALVTPLREAEKSIWDRDVASYYHLLLGKMDFLNDPPATTTQIKKLYNSPQ